VGAININTPNFIKNGLINALNTARSGGESPLFDKMLNGFYFAQYYKAQSQQIAGKDWYPVGDPRGPTGADIVRTLYASNLANGDYATIATNLANLNYDKNTFGGCDYGAEPCLNQEYPDIPSGVQGAILRTNGFPENYILGNPQMGKANFRTNLIRSNYHSLQAQVQLSPMRGLMFTSTYTLSKQLADQPGGNMFQFYGGNDSWTDP